MGTENGGGCANLLRRVVWPGHRARGNTRIVEVLDFSTKKAISKEQRTLNREETTSTAAQSKIESPHTSTPQHHHGPTTAPETP
jgi:hypothetical protein